MRPGFAQLRRRRAEVRISRRWAPTASACRRPGMHSGRGTAASRSRRRAVITTTGSADRPAGQHDQTLSRRRRRVGRTCAGLILAFLERLAQGSSAGIRRPVIDPERDECRLLATKGSGRTGPAVNWMVRQLCDSIARVKLGCPRANHRRTANPALLGRPAPQGGRRFRRGPAAQGRVNGRLRFHGVGRGCRTGWCRGCRSGAFLEPCCPPPARPDCGSAAAACRAEVRRRCPLRSSQWATDAGRTLELRVAPGSARNCWCSSPRHHQRPEPDRSTRGG